MTITLHKSRRVRVASLALAGLLTLSACSTGDGGSTGSSSGASTAAHADIKQVSIAMTESSEPEAGFDPIRGWGVDSHVHEPLIQSSLIRTNVDLEFENDLATSYEVSDDGMTWTFTIRDDVKFTDGEKLTASDVAFTLNEMAKAEDAIADLGKFDRAEAPDDTTVILHMEEPDNTLLYTLANVGIVPEHAYGPDYGQNPIGSGRYILGSWSKGEQVIFKANPDYYGEKPKMDRVVVAFMTEDAALAGAQSGQIDVVYTSAVYSDQKIANYELVGVESVDSRGLSLPTNPTGGTAESDGKTYPTGNDITADVAIRRAINYAIDRDRMVDNVLNGHGTVAYTVADGTPWASPEMKVDTDLAKAKQILEEAGWVDTNGDGVVEKDGKAAEFDFAYPSSDSTRQALALDFAAQLKEAGIKANAKGMSWDEIWDVQYTWPVVWGWGSQSPRELYNLLKSDAWGNFPQYKSNTVDQHLEDALGRTTLEDSYKDYQLAQWDGTDGVAPQGAATWVWLANIDHLYFVREGLNLAEQKPHPHGHGWSLANNVDEWTWNK